MHGTLKMTYMAIEFNFQQVLLKTLFPTMNTLKDMAVLNVEKDGKYAPILEYSSSATEQMKERCMNTS